MRRMFSYKVEEKKGGKDQKVNIQNRGGMAHAPIHINIGEENWNLTETKVKQKSNQKDTCMKERIDLSGDNEFELQQ